VFLSRRLLIVIQILGMMKARDKTTIVQEEEHGTNKTLSVCKGVKNITTFRSYALFVIVLLLRGIGAVMGLRVRPRLL
jgi:hypothetical protein